MDAQALLKTLVLIDSGTEQISQVNRVQQTLAAELKHLGFDVRSVSNPDLSQRSGDLLIGRRQGKRPSSQAEKSKSTGNLKTISFIVHADTVFEPTSGFSGFEISADGKTARGPGVIDDKGGMVVALKGIEAFLKAYPQTQYSLQMISSPSEETGSKGFKDLFRELSKETQIALGFEPGMDDGSIISARKGVSWYELEVTGREAHAGRDHAHGINAALELSEKLVKISRLTDYKENITVSIGRIEGGQDKFNVVCGWARAKIDARLPDLKSQQRFDAQLKRLILKPYVRSPFDKKGAHLELKQMGASTPFAPEKQSQAFLKEYLRIVKSVEGITIKAVKSGGSADINKMSREGIILIDGLGALGGHMHTQKEFIVLSSLTTRARALTQFLSFLEFKKPNS